MTDTDETITLPPLTREQRRIIRSLAGASVGGIIGSHVLAGGVLSLFADRIGMSPMTIGALFFVIQVPAVFQLWGARHVDTHGCKRMVVRVFAGSGALALPFLLAPQLGAWLGPWACTAGIFLGLTAFAAANNLALSGWMPLVRHNLPAGRRAELVGRVNQIAFRVAFAFLLICLLAMMQQRAAIGHFQVVFALGAVAVSSRALFARGLHDTESLPAETEQPLWEDLHGIWADRPFRRFLVFVTLSYFALGLAVPFRPLYIGSLGFSDRFVMLANVPLAVAVYSLTARGWGRLADRYGSRGVYSLGGLGLVLGFIILVLPQSDSGLSRALILLAIAVAVTSWGAFDAGNVFRLFTLVPRQNQSLYMASYTLAQIGALACGSLAGGALVKLVRLRLTPGALAAAPGLDYRILFGVAGGFIILATLYSRRMRDLHEASTPALLLHLRLRAQRQMSFGLTSAFMRFRKSPRPKQ